MNSKVNTNHVQASAKAIKGSVQKVNLVCDLVRKTGKGGLHNVLLQLQFCKKRVAKDILELLKSAISNAENNFGMDIDNLCIDSVLVGKSFTLKRFHARGRGRASRISKPYSNVKIILKELSNWLWVKKRIQKV